MEPTFYADILFFAAVAGFIAYRLYTVLGRKDGTEQNITHRVKEMWETKTQNPVKKDDNVIALPPPPVRKRVDITPAPNVAEAAQTGVKAIMEKDRSFTPERFIGGAQSAFEIILSAFAEGNKPHLKTLLDPTLYNEFEADIDRRIAAGETLTTTLVALVRAEVITAELQNTLATVTVAFESEQISCTKDTNGAVIAGDPTVSERLHDKWVFQRNISSRNPTWLLIDTDAAQ